MASTIATALMLAVSAMSPFSGTTALAVPLGSTDAVLLACNNTFSPVKFPLEYDVIARPSANPIVPGSSFTVDFDVTVKAAAAFLNGVCIPHLLVRVRRSARFLSPTTWPRLCRSLVPRALQ
jgi:hypothetical protein